MPAINSTKHAIFSEKAEQIDSVEDQCRVT